MLNRTQKEDLDMIALNPFNTLITTSVNTKPVTYPSPYTILQGNKIHISGLYKTHTQFSITYKDKFQDQ